MHEIYRNANQIFVDLGDAPKGIVAAVALLKRASEAFDESIKSQPQADGTVEHSRPARIEVTVEEALALSRFARISWFKRLWVVQEVCLWDVYTAYPPLFLCGEHTLQLLDLINAASGFGRFPPLIRNDPGVVTAELKGAILQGSGWAPAFAGVFLEYYKIISKQGPAQSIHWYLQRTWDLQSTNPADKIYGLLGLVQGQCEYIPKHVLGHYRNLKKLLKRFRQ
jgi:hypothetical protein